MTTKILTKVCGVDILKALGAGSGKTAADLDGGTARRLAPETGAGGAGAEFAARLDILQKLRLVAGAADAGAAGEPDRLASTFAALDIDAPETPEAAPDARPAHAEALPPETEEMAPPVENGEAVAVAETADAADAPPAPITSSDVENDVEEMSPAVGEEDDGLTRAAPLGGAAAAPVAPQPEEVAPEPGREPAPETILSGLSGLSGRAFIDGSTPMTYTPDEPAPPPAQLAAAPPTQAPLMPATHDETISTPALDDLRRLDARPALAGDAAALRAPVEQAAPKPPAATEVAVKTAPEPAPVFILPESRGAPETSGAARHQQPAPARFEAPEAARLALAAIRAERGGGIDLRLDPPDLGRVRIQFSFERADVVVATVSSERGETLDLMRRHGDELAKALERAGFESVTLDFADAADDPRRDVRQHADARLAEPEDAADPAPRRVYLRAFDGARLDRFV